jgi:hypothetical protein
MLNEVKSRLSLNKTSYLVIGAIFTLFLFSCNPSDSTGASVETLANQIEGTFKGILQNPSFTANDYEIIVSEINDTRVSIAPASGSNSATFEVDLESVDLETEISGVVTTIILKSPDDLLEENGTFVASTGGLSYVFHLGGTNEHNVEVFVGHK